MSAITSSNVTSGFIDLATFDEIEKYMYGGPDATAYFVRETRKSTWFTQVPVVLTKAAGQSGFGADWAVSISRAGDYLLHTWLRLTTPSVTLTSAAGVANGNVWSLRWTRNLMHNIIRECNITFNDLVAARFDNYHLDFWAAFTVPASKRNGYDNMVGNVSDLIDPVLGGVAIPSYTLNLPLPFFYGRDSGVALPTAALPYNEMRINFSFRDWWELLVLSPADDSGQNVPLSQDGSQLVGGVPALGNCQVWANYAIVSNDERKRMACAPRDILVEQVQTASKQSFTPTTNPQQSFDIRFSHAIKVLFFAVRNTTCSSEWSNYATSSPVVDLNGGSAVINFYPSVSADPILQTSLQYENTFRLAQMGSDYFSLVNPWYHAPTIPDFIGYHSYSYSLDFMSLDPMGSTNYGKLTNVSIIPEASSSAITAATGDAQSSGTGYTSPQTYQFIVTCINNNIIRVSGGALGKNGKPKIGRCFKSCGNTFRGKHFNNHRLTSLIC
ncbi:hypothetical protein EBU95_19895 [bacterium]|nr:hypothetical protein [bacterium]